MVLPQGVAFATLAGMPPAYGLYAAIVPCIVAALFGSSRLMVTGPANAISLTTMALVAPLAAVGSSEYVGLVLTLTFMVGALQLQLLLGLARVGKWVDMVPHSVIAGFTAGAAILIVNSQVGALLGLEPRGLSVAQTLQAVFTTYQSVQTLPMIAALATIPDQRPRSALEPMAAARPGCSDRRHWRDLARSRRARRATAHGAGTARGAAAAVHPGPCDKCLAWWCQRW